MRNRFASLSVFITAVLGCSQFTVAEEKPIQPAKVELGRPVSFEKDVFPILDANCIACHNVAKKEGSLVLENVEDLIKGACAAASRKATEHAQAEMAKLTGGLNIPGLSDMLGGAG